MFVLGQYRWRELEYDLWTAAFFWPIGTADALQMMAPTQQVLDEMHRGQAPSVKIREQVRTLKKQHQFFHWGLVFADVFNRAASGFDVVLGNPPWERIKLQEKEWFATRAPEIANAPNAAARRRLIDELAQDDFDLHAAFETDRSGADNQSHFVRTSKAYPLCGRGDVNTYTIFAELARTLINPHGRAGIIVPSGIATDDTTKYFFQDIMEQASLISLYDFENRHGIFEGVHRSYKFCLLTMRGTDAAAASSAAPAEFVFFALDVADLRDEERRFTLTAEEIGLLNPNTRTCPIFRSQRDAVLTKAIYRRVPVLVNEEAADGNPWGISFLRMFDMSNDSHLFRTREQLAKDDYRLVGNRFVRDGGEEYLPLYEAKMFHHFDHRWATYTGDDVRDMSINEKQDVQRSVLPRYWVEKSEANRRFDGYDREWLVGFRDITNGTNERTAIFSIIPRVGVGNKAPLLITKVNSSLMIYLSCNASSFAFDYAARQSLGGTTMNFFIVKQLAFLPPHTYLEVCPWKKDGDESILQEWLLPYILELAYTAWDLQPFAQDCGYDGPPFRWDEERRFLLRGELDAAYFHLYGIARADVDYIMETFPIVKRKDEQAHGEYRTKRVILEMYDAMAQAMATGMAYQTRLDPPPADVRVAHGAVQASITANEDSNELVMLNGSNTLLETQEVVIHSA